VMVYLLYTLGEEDASWRPLGETKQKGGENQPQDSAFEC
jgi:hypothetical protein